RCDAATAGGARAPRRQLIDVRYATARDSGTASSRVREPSPATAARPSTHRRRASTEQPDGRSAARVRHLVSRAVRVPHRSRHGSRGACGGGACPAGATRLHVVPADEVESVAGGRPPGSAEAAAEIATRGRLPGLVLYL